MAQEYYIQHLGDYAFDFILWWGPKSSGYTYDIRKAGRYTAAEAESICKIRGKEQAWPIQLVPEGMECAISIEKLNRAGLKASFAPNKIERRKKKKMPQFHHCTSDLCLAYKELAEARSGLLACFRLGKVPSESLMRQIDKVMKIVREHEGLLHEKETKDAEKAKEMD